MEWPWRLYRDVCPQIKSPSELARGGRDGLGSGLGRRLKMDFQGEIMKDGSRIAGSVQFSCSVVSESLRPHELQHARPSCSSPTPTPGVHSDSRPLNQWCHPTISSSVIPFSSCLQSLPASESFPMSQLFAWGGQSIGVSSLASFLPKKSQDWSPLECG